MGFRPAQNLVHPADATMAATPSPVSLSSPSLPRSGPTGNHGVMESMDYVPGHTKGTQSAGPGFEGLML